jgi:hypothetical protein
MPTGKLRNTRRIWYFSNDQVKMNQMGGLCPTYGGTGELHTVEKRERNRTLGRTSCRWEDNIKLELQKVGLRAWIGLFCLRTGTGVRLL